MYICGESPVMRLGDPEAGTLSMALYTLDPVGILTVNSVKSVMQCICMAMASLPCHFGYCAVHTCDLLKLVNGSFLSFVGMFNA